MNNEQIKRNLIAKEKIEEGRIKLRDIKSSVLASLFNTYEGGCTACGGYVSEPNLSFFGFDVSLVKCMNCQKIKEEEKMRDDNYPPSKEMIYTKKTKRRSITNF